MRYYHVDVTVVVLVVAGVVGTGVIIPGTGAGLCIAVLMAGFTFKSGEVPCGVFAPNYSLPYVFLFLV